MDIKEKAKEYADGKVLNAITAALEEAYMSGYKDGYDDGYADREQPQSEVKYEKLTYIDLGLPSGTKWSVGYLTKTNGSIELFDFSSAVVFNLPSKEQYLELLGNTEQHFGLYGNSNGTEFVSSINGARFYLPCGHFAMREGSIINKDNYLFWLKDEVSTAQQRLSVCGAKIQRIWNYFKLPVVLVSK